MMVILIENILESNEKEKVVILTHLIALSENKWQIHNSL